MIWQDILNFILPSRCISCDCILDDGGKICQDCFNKLTFISQPYCQKCGLPFENKLVAKDMLCGLCLKKEKSPFRFSRSALKYDDFSKKLIVDFKFFDKTQNSVLFGFWLKKAGADIFDSGIDVIIPVPLHFSRLLKRKYNQSGLLAQELSKQSGIKVDYYSLKKIKKTKPQVAFLGRARNKNLKDAFQADSHKIKGQRILLIDDVMTTGSTLRECAKALLTAGAKSVDSLTIARVY